MAIVKTGIEIDTNSSFSNPTSFEENGAVSSIEATGLSAETAYFVKAYVVDDQGNRIDGENTETFTTAVAGIDYFYVQNEYNGANNFTIKKNGNPSNGTDLAYSLDGNDWTTCTYDSSQECNITLNNLNDKIYLRSTTGLGTNWSGKYHFHCTQQYSIGGKITSLVDYHNMGNITTIPKGLFCCTFQYETNLRSIKHVDFDSVTDVDSRFLSHAFEDCSNLEDVFDTSSLTSLIRTGDGCVMDSAFLNCVKITKGLDLRNVTSISSIFDNFDNLYNGCSLIDTIYAPNVNSWSTADFGNWVYGGIPGSGTFYAPAGVTIPTGYSGIPSGWTRIDY